MSSEQGNHIPCRKLQVTSSLQSHASEANSPSEASATDTRKLKQQASEASSTGLSLDLRACTVSSPIPIETPPRKRTREAASPDQDSQATVQILETPQAPKKRQRRVQREDQMDDPGQNNDSPAKILIHSPMSPMCPFPKHTDSEIMVKDEGNSGASNSLPKIQIHSPMAPVREFPKLTDSEIMVKDEGGASSTATSSTGGH